MKSYTDPHRDGHERFRVSKKNFGNKSQNLSHLNELQDWDTTLGDGLDKDQWDDDNWYPDTKI